MKILAIVAIVFYALLSLYGAMSIKTDNPSTGALGGLIGILLLIAYTWGVWYLASTGP